MLPCEVITGHPLTPLPRRILHNCHDDAAKFLHLLMNPGCNYLVQEDFVPFLQVGPASPRTLLPSSRPGFPSTLHAAWDSGSLPLGNCLRKRWLRGQTL